MYRFNSCADSLLRGKCVFNVQGPRKSYSIELARTCTTCRTLAITEVIRLSSHGIVVQHAPFSIVVVPSAVWNISYSKRIATSEICRRARPFLVYSNYTFARRGGIFIFDVGISTYQAVGRSSNMFDIASNTDC